METKFYTTDILTEVKILKEPKFFLSSQGTSIPKVSDIHKSRKLEKRRGSKEVIL